MTSALPYIGRADIANRLPYDALIEQLNETFAGFVEPPTRWIMEMDDVAPGNELLLMPAWNKRSLAVKLATICPGNQGTGHPTINGVVMLFDSTTGEPKAVIDAGELTSRRTAAASALASRFLSRADSRRLLLVGSGRLAPCLAEAHAAVRNFEVINIVARDRTRATEVIKLLPANLAGKARAAGMDELPQLAAEADVISTATRATAPIIKGDWLKPGVHLDLVGGYKPTMREVDDDAIRRARIFVDTHSGVMAEAGDILDPIERGVIDGSDIQADLHALSSGRHPGRIDDRETTLFKSVGSAIEDLAAAELLA